MAASEAANGKCRFDQAVLEWYCDIMSSQDDFDRKSARQAYSFLFVTSLMSWAKFAVVIVIPLFAVLAFFGVPGFRSFSWKSLLSFWLLCFLGWRLLKRAGSIAENDTDVDDEI